MGQLRVPVRGPAVSGDRAGAYTLAVTDLAAALAKLDVELPPGRLVHGDEGDAEQPALWVSDGPAPAGSWAALRGSGLWPLLLDHLRDEPRRPWDDGELDPEDPGVLDAETVLSAWWAGHAGDGAAVAPYEQWPGLAAPIKPRRDPDSHADQWAGELLASDRKMRLGLVAAGRGADAISVAGWQGAINYTGPASLTAVVRSWEERFGVRVIGLGFAELYLSVSAPPGDQETALRVAAEHFAFCPDGVWQGTETLEKYATQLINAPFWSFWWD
ncbi:hypothetical protein Ahu01nite_073130 [Winogradskya humida]|uniref:DUF4253 domain-containing protein n=1 Tax=Winogradskya humida TaxID=113566 RepID=A0ABQ4A052_9ACTN|nr:hypothetical protein Ahu01nite_073130 [Actinoplanes humidus]